MTVSMGSANVPNSRTRVENWIIEFREFGAIFEEWTFKFNSTRPGLDYRPTDRQRMKLKLEIKKEEFETGEEKFPMQFRY